MDALSQALVLLRPLSSLSAGLNAGGDWGIDFRAHEGIKFNAVRKGACWLKVESDDSHYRLEAGDCFLLTKGRPFVLASDLAHPRIKSDDIYDYATDGVATCNGGGEFFLVGGRFTFFGDGAQLVFGQLPPVVLVRRASDQASVLNWGLDRLVDELRSDQPGSAIVAGHLSHIMLVQILRLYLAQQGDGKFGWLSALSDRQLCAAMNAIHTDPAQRWNVAQLAEIAGMSRSSFAERFKKSVGMSPIEYVTRWRMLLATDKLRSNQVQVSQIALSLGYESESAFSTAFKRALAESPSRYRERVIAAEMCRKTG